MTSKAIRRPSVRRSSGFTLIELMTVILIIAILAVIAMNVYSSYITRSKIQAAKGDLSALALNLENELQGKLVYGTHNTTTTSDTMAAYSGWKPAEINDFTYTVASSSSSYTLKAAGIQGSLSTCVLTLPSASSSASTSIGSVNGCGSVTTW